MSAFQPKSELSQKRGTKSQQGRERAAYERGRKQGLREGAGLIHELQTQIARLEAQARKVKRKGHYPPGKVKRPEGVRAWDKMTPDERLVHYWEVIVPTSEKMKL